MKRITSFVVALMVLAAALGGFASPAQAAGNVTYTGTLSPEDPYHDYVVAMNAGDTIEINLICPPGSPLDLYVEVYDSNGTRLDWDDDSGVECDNYYGAYLEFTAPADGEYIIRATTFNYANFEEMWCGCPPGECGPVLTASAQQEEESCSGDYILMIVGDFTLPGGEPAPAPGAGDEDDEPAPVVVAPGCRPVYLPEGAVVGTFLTDTVAHWAPGKVTEPNIVFNAGKTAWVLGVDESGEFYKLAYLCDYLWVPVEAMGPNYDEVWNGTPLPTTVVK